MRGSEAGSLEGDRAGMVHCSSALVRQSCGGSAEEAEGDRTSPDASALVSRGSLRTNVVQRDQGCGGKVKRP